MQRRSHLTALPSAVQKTLDTTRGQAYRSSEVFMSVNGPSKAAAVCSRRTRSEPTLVDARLRPLRRGATCTLTNCKCLCCSANRSSTSRPTCTATWSACRPYPWRRTPCLSPFWPQPPNPWGLLEPDANAHPKRTSHRDMIFPPVMYFHSSTKTVCSVEKSEWNRCVRRVG